MQTRLELISIKFNNFLKFIEDKLKCDNDLYRLLQNMKMNEFILMMQNLKKLHGNEIKETQIIELLNYYKIKCEITKEELNKLNRYFNMFLELVN